MREKKPKKGRKRIMVLLIACLLALGACDTDNASKGNSADTQRLLNECSAQGKYAVAVAEGQYTSAYIYCVDWPKGR